LQNEKTIIVRVYVFYLVYIKIAIQFIEALRITEIFLKAALSAAFKNISGVYVSAKRCKVAIAILESNYQEKVHVAKSTWLNGSNG
jgi:hypothetical protein